MQRLDAVWAAGEMALELGPLVSVEGAESVDRAEILEFLVRHSAASDSPASAPRSFPRP
jgi:hypothetical protein